MTEIETDEELSLDWDWFACDENGHIGHFTTAGFRSLPSSVKNDREAVIELTKHLLERNETSKFSLSATIEAGRFKDKAAQERYLRSFVAAARRGLFSYDTELIRGRAAEYYLVARPDTPLTIGELPADIRTLLTKTQATVSFHNTQRITEAQTLPW